MRIHILDTNFLKIKVLDIFNSMIWTDRYSKAGDFEIVVDATNDNIQALREDYFITNNESDHVMIIESINLKTDASDGNQLIIKGRSLESILERRIVWAQTSLSGSFQAGIKKLLDENVISPEDPDRQITNFVFEETTDPIVASLSIDQQFMGDNIYEVISLLCSANGIGFKITLESDNSFVFKLYAGSDRSFDQVENPFVSFSPELENISETNYFHSKVILKTVTLVGGEGEGSDRLMAQVLRPGVNNVGLDRRENFTDARDISTVVNGETISGQEYYTLLYERGLIDLLDHSAVSSFEGKVDPTVNHVFGSDFFMGDIVQFENEYGLTGRTRVIEVVFSQDLSGEGTYPTFETIE